LPAAAASWAGSAAFGLVPASRSKEEFVRILKVTLPARAAATPHFQFHSDGTAAGDHAVAAMRAVCEQDFTALKVIFRQGDPPGLPFVLHVDPSAGGAFHLSCEGTEIWLIPQDAPTLLVAEVVEVLEAQAQGWDCGLTNGEGLSRALASVVRPAQLLGDLDGDVQGWWNGGNPADYVNDNSATDQDQQANACGTLFLFFLRSQLAFPWQQVVAAGAPTLGATYQQLTGKAGGQGFQDLVSALQPLQQPDGTLDIPTSGNPFPTPAPAAVR
jgi:hypothetical protein